MMALGTLIVTLVATAGWLFLNWRALREHGLTFEQKMVMGVVWAVAFAALAFVFTRMGF